MFVRRDLCAPQIAVQSCHAVIESTKDSPYQNEHPSVIICGMKSEKELINAVGYLDEKKIRNFQFKEPDIDNELTAVSTCLIEEDQRHLFRKFQLLKI